MTVRVVREWLEGQSQRFEITEGADVSGVRVTLLVRSPRTGRRVALMYIDQRYGVDAWGDDYVQLKAADVPASWIFALRPMFFRLPQPSAAAGPEDPVARDRARGDLVLDRALYREMRSVGLWPLLISLERRELGNLVTPTGRLAGPLGLQPPESGDRVLHLVPTPIADARLTRYGIATQAVPERFLQHAWQEPPPPPPTPPRQTPSGDGDGSDRPVRTPVMSDVVLPEVAPSPVPTAPRPVTDERAQRWARARPTLQKQLGESGLADELAKPLPTDVECDLLGVHWHTMLAVWLSRRPGGQDPWQLRRRLADAGAGPKLTTAAVEGFLAWWRERGRR